MTFDTRRARRLALLGLLSASPLFAGLVAAQDTTTEDVDKGQEPAPSARPRPAGAGEAAHDIEAGRAERQRERRARCASDPRVVLGQVTATACEGADLFFRETFGGNGRTCSSCHPAQNNYVIDPAYVAELPDDDPLFVAEYEPRLAQLELPGLLRDSAMILVNADGLEAPTERFVMRSVQHLLGLSMSIQRPPDHNVSPAHSIDGTLKPVPFDRLGWSGDGAPGEGRLRDFADGAIVQHATRSLARVAGQDYFLPTDAERDAMAEFTGSIGRMNDLDLELVALADAAAERGRIEFVNGECGGRCHGNAGANIDIIDGPDPATANRLGSGNLTVDIGTALARLPAVDALGILRDGGHGRGPQDLDGDGQTDAFGNRGMNMPSVIEAADTGPMFHTNAVESVEDAIRFYTSEAFASSLSAREAIGTRATGEPMVFSDSQVAELGRFLRVINTALNLQMALFRMEAALDIADRFGNREWQTERGLWELAYAELEDAVQVLSAAHGLHRREQRSLQNAMRELRAATRHCGSARKRWRQLDHVRERVAEAHAALGQGLSLTMGQGTLLF